MDDVHSWLSSATAISLTLLSSKVLQIEMCRQGNYRNALQMMTASTCCFPVAEQ